MKIGFSDQSLVGLSVLSVFFSNFSQILHIVRVSLKGFQFNWLKIKRIYLGLLLITHIEIQDQNRDGTRDWTRYSRPDLDMSGRHRI